MEDWCLQPPASFEVGFYCLVAATWEGRHHDHEDPVVGGVNCLSPSWKTDIVRTICHTNALHLACCDFVLVF